MRFQEIQDAEDVRSSTIAAIVVGLIAVAIVGWVMVRTIGDDQAAPQPEPSPSPTIVDDGLDTPIAGEQAARPASDQFELDDIDLAGLDRQDTGGTPTTEPPSNPDPNTPTTQPKPPKKTPETTPPPPRNEAPSVEGLVVTSQGGQVNVKAAVTDPEADMASIRLILSEGDKILSAQNVAPDTGAASQAINIDFPVDTADNARRQIAVTITVVDGAGDGASQTTEHQVVRRTKVWVSAVSMTLNSTCFDNFGKVALALNGELAAAGHGIDNSTTLSGEFRADNRSMILADEHSGYVDGEKPWFVLMTATPDLVTVNGEIINLGKIQTLHTQDGSFTKTFEQNGCSGAIAYTITAELL